MRSVFLNLNSQFESNQPLIIPRLPEIKLVNKRIFIEPMISSFPVKPREKFPFKMMTTPSLRKLKIGNKTKQEIIKAEKSKSLDRLNLIRNFLKYLSNKLYLFLILILIQ